jgi:hypothetical protein
MAARLADSAARLKASKKSLSDFTAKRLSDLQAQTAQVMTDKVMEKKEPAKKAGSNLWLWVGGAVAAAAGLGYWRYKKTGKVI